MNLFEESRPYIPMINIQPAKIVNDLIVFKTNNFDNILELFCRCVAMLKYHGVMCIEQYKVDKFNKNKFDSHLLKLGVMSRDTAFVISALKKATAYTASYLATKLHKKDDNPQFKYFQAFARGNMEKMDLVFSVKSCTKNKDALLVYENKQGDMVEVTTDSYCNGLNKEKLNELMESGIFDENEKIDLEYATKKHKFPKKRKVIFEAAKFKFAGGGNPMEEKKILSLI